jgi:predicted porin
MNKLFLTMTLAFCTMIASAQYSAMTTITSVEEGDETTYNVTDKLGVGYQVGEKLMVGLTMNGEDKYELLGRYALMNGVWGTCIYSYAADDFQETELMDNVKLGLGYSFKVWNNLYVDPNYTMPAKADEAGEREGSFNLSISYKL